MCRKTARPVLLEHNWIVIELCALNNSLCSLSMSSSSSAMKSSLQGGFLTIYYVFHLFRSSLFLEAARLCRAPPRGVVREAAQISAQSANRDFGWAIAGKRTCQFWSWQWSFLLIIVQAISIWHVILFATILFTARAITKSRCRFRDDINISTFTINIEMTL